MKGSASRPSSATMKGTRCAISPDTNATSRESLSSLETTTQHLALRAAARAAASCGRRSSASVPLPVSASTNSPMIVIPSASPLLTLQQPVPAAVQTNICIVPSSAIRPVSTPSCRWPTGS